MSENDIQEVEQKKENKKKDSTHYDNYIKSLDVNQKSKHVFKEKIKRRVKKSTEINMLKVLSPYDILLKPLIETEKGHKAIEESKYIFKVHQSANKNDIKNAFKVIFNIMPQRVNIMNVPFKGRFNRKLVRRGFKKAIIILKKGETIKLVK